ncbi:MAG: FkbM family methyltransferase [Thiotrichaceae bacterium]|nr:FkbM family methyltransferase [Thiotrichaceae bacterium]
MPIPDRIPTMLDSLETLISLGVDIESVLDVGVLYGTFPLMKFFPNKVHHLFEPVDTFFEKIEHNYKNIKHNLHQVALSNENGKAWQLLISAEKNNIVTHSQINHEYVPISDSVVACKPISKAKLDSYIENMIAKPPYLLKIDVDGHELSILEGSINTLQKCNIVIIEVTKKSFIERSIFLEKHGFMLFDIVELSYYAGAFWQADLIFINRKLLTKNKNLIPMETKEYLVWNQWFDLSKKVFKH